MIAIVDTHALIWHFEDNPLLGKAAKNALLSTSWHFILPSIVLAELLYYMRKLKRQKLFNGYVDAVARDSRFTIKPLSVEDILGIPDGLEMHDGIIASVTLQNPGALLLTKDNLLTRWAGARATWK